MKIRCEQNSLRLRLRKSELAELKTRHLLRTEVAFPDGSVFGWELRLEEGLDGLTVNLSQGNILVQAPSAAALAWADNNEVGMEAFLPLPDGASLQVLVEKDFPCKDRPEEDKSDFFTDLAEKHPPLC